MKSLKKVLAMLMAIALVFSLAACSGSSDEEETTLPVGQTPISTSAIKIGVLFTTSGEEDDVNDYNYAQRQGLATMKNVLGIADAQVIEINGITGNDVDKFDAAIDSLVAQGCNIIFGTSCNYMDLMEDVAEEEANSQIIFANTRGNNDYGNLENACNCRYCRNLPDAEKDNQNMVRYFGRVYESAYLSGIAAGMKAKETKNAKIGYVAPKDNTNAEIANIVNAFTLGAQSVYSKAVVKVSVTDSWADEKAEEAAVKALKDAGCGVISQYRDSNVTSAASEEALSTPVWHWENYYITIIKEVINGIWSREDYFGGIKEGVVDIAINEEKAAKGTSDAVKAAKDKIMNGELVIFDKGLVKADGTVINEKLTDEEIHNMTYFVKGAEILK